MLHARRFDYIFADSIESQDLVASGFKKDQFKQITYTTTSVKSLSDPALTQISIACSIHPATLAAMPYINKWISLIRGGKWKFDKTNYRNKLDSKNDEVDYPSPGDNLAGKFHSQLKAGIVDAWYSVQQAHFPQLKLYPEPSRAPPLPSLPKSNQTLLWHAIYESKSAVAVLSEAQFYHRSILDTDETTENSVDHNNPNFSWNHGLLWKYLSHSLSDRLEHFDFAHETPGVPQLKMLRLESGIKKLTLFASGLRPEDLAPFEAVLNSQSLESLSVFDAGPETTRRIVSLLPQGLKYLNLTNSSLSSSDLPERVKKLGLLRHLHLNGTQLGETKLGELVRNLPLHLESLSLGWQGPSWSVKNAKAFGARSWPNLKALDLACDYLENQHLAAIQNALPRSLEKINLSGSFINPQGMSAFFKLNFASLTSFEKSYFGMSSPFFPVTLPKELESLDLYYGKSDFHSLGIQGELRFLDFATQVESDPAGIIPLISHLGAHVSVLNLSNLLIDRKVIETLVSQRKIQEIDRLDLSGNHLTDESIELLSTAGFSVKYLNLRDNWIRNRGAEIISRRWLGQLKSLDLSSNPISEGGVKILAERIPVGLERLELSSLFGLDVRALAEHLPRGLRNLNLSGNQLSTPDMEILAPRLPPYLYSLNLKESAFDEKGAWVLAKWMPRHLVHLNLRSVPLGSQGFEILFKQFPKTLAELELENATLSSAAVQSLIQSIPPQLRLLSVEGVDWSRTDSARLLKALPSSIQTLRWSGPPIDLQGARNLSQNWPNNLRRLQLFGTDLGDAGLTILAKSLSRTLERLDLGNNKITDIGLVALSSQPLESLFKLVLSGNRLTEKGIQALSAKSKRIASLELDSCDLNAAAFAALGSHLLEKLRILYIDNNPKAGTEEVFTLLKRLNPEMAVLGLGSVGLTFDSRLSWIDLFPVNLSEVNLSGNEIGEYGREKVDEEFKRRQKKLGSIVVIK